MNFSQNRSRPVAVTIGNFDGVHRGHLALIAAARRAVGTEGRVIVLAFDPHPLSVLRPETCPARLSTFAQRERWLSAAGADVVEQLIPDEAFLSRSPAAFIDGLVERFAPAVVVEGADFRFGHRRAGTLDTLRRLGAERDVQVVEVETVEAALADTSIVSVSSSLTRWLLANGRVDDARRLLGRAYELETTVERGAQRGRVIGFPTMNLRLDDRQVPAEGVYVGVALLPEGGRYIAAISVGTNPTFDGRVRTCEAHLLDYDGPLDRYGQTIRLSFSHWLRDQTRYPAVEPLIEQLHRDVARVRALVGPVTEPA